MVEGREVAGVVAHVDAAVREDGYGPAGAAVEDLRARELVETGGRGLGDDQLALLAHHDQPAVGDRERALAEAALAPLLLAREVDALQHVLVEAVEVLLPRRRAAHLV